MSNSEVNTNNILTEIGTRINKSYELESDFVDSVKQIVKDALSPYHVSSKVDTSSVTDTSTKGGKKKKEKDVNKAPRKITPYNIFMQEQSAVEKEKGTPANQRLSQIGGRWKGLTAEEKKVYEDRANAKNASVSDTASVATAP